MRILSFAQISFRNRSTISKQRAGSRSHSKTEYCTRSPQLSNCPHAHGTIDYFPQGFGYSFQWATHFNATRTGDVTVSLSDETGIRFNGQLTSTPTCTKMKNTVTIRRGHITVSMGYSLQRPRALWISIHFDVLGEKFQWATHSNAHTRTAHYLST